MTVTEEGMSPILLANRVPVVVLGVKYPWAWEAFTSNGLSVTVPPAEAAAGVVATGTGGWLAGAWVWSGVAGRRIRRLAKKRGGDQCSRHERGASRPQGGGLFRKGDMDSIHKMCVGFRLRNQREQQLTGGIISGKWGHAGKSGCR
jgi:hypothetical protein